MRPSGPASNKTPKIGEAAICAHVDSRLGLRISAMAEGNGISQSVSTRVNNPALPVPKRLAATARTRATRPSRTASPATATNSKANAIGKANRKTQRRSGPVFAPSARTAIQTSKGNTIAPRAHGWTTTWRTRSDTTGQKAAISPNAIAASQSGDSLFGARGSLATSAISCAARSRFHPVAESTRSPEFGNSPRSRSYSRSLDRSTQAGSPMRSRHRKFQQSVPLTS